MTLSDSLKQNQPISITGAIVHAFKWFPYFLGCHTDSFINPNYNEIENPVGIYFVHGTADFSISGEALCRRLIQKNDLASQIDQIHLVHFNQRFRFNSISEFSNQLLGQINHHGHARVILIGHSRGGLVASYFAEELAETNDITVEQVITLSSPFKGSPLARPLACISSAQSSISQMCPNSEFLQTLNQHVINSPEKYHFYSAENDSVVDPDASFPHTERPLNSTLVSRHGHLSMMSSNRITAHTKKLINYRLTGAPAPTFHNETYYRSPLIKGLLAAGYLAAIASIVIGALVANTLLAGLPILLGVAAKALSLGLCIGGGATLWMTGLFHLTWPQEINKTQPGLSPALA